MADHTTETKTITEGQKKLVAVSREQTQVQREQSVIFERIATALEKRGSTDS
jgi:hypothetical protein